MMSAETKSPGIGLLLSDDLIFASRITGTARELGFSVKQVKTPDQLITLAAQERPQCVIVDLSNQGVGIDQLVRRLHERCASAPRVVAFGSHVDTGTLQAAREAGCSPVLTRSKFVEDLPNLLPEWMGGPRK